MRTEIRHRWETVALSSGASLCATHGSLVCGDGEHRYDVTSYRSDGKVYTTLMVYKTDGTCPSSFAHEFVSDRPWGNTDMEAALIRFCESRDGGLRKDGSVRDDWGGFVRFVEEKTDDQGNDIYGSPVVTALRWMPFDGDSHIVKAAEAGVMDEVDTGADDDHVDTAADDGADDMVANDTASDSLGISADSWEIWLWHGSLDLECSVPSMTVYGQRRITDRDEANSLWERCRSFYEGTPRMLVRITSGKLSSVEDLKDFTVNVGNGVGFGGRL